MRLDPDPWLAELFEYPVYRVKSTQQPQLDATSKALLESGSRVFVYARVDVADLKATHALIDSGFRIVDVAVKFTRAPSDVSDSSSAADVRNAAPADFERVIDIAGSAFTYSRFHLDPYVSKDLANKIKRSW